jgi:hypothetical protein
MNLFKKLYNIGDKLEDRIRAYFSHYPIIYALIGGVGVVLFWRGVWHTADFIMLKITSWQSAEGGIDLSNELWWDGPLSLLLGAVILLLIGVFVSNFIGNEIIISGLKGDKKMAEKTEAELKNEQRELSEAKKELDEIAARLKQVEKEILKNNLKH